MELYDLRERVEKLERDSHPPVQFVACNVCWAVVFDAQWDLHRAGHDGTRDAGMA